MQRNVDANNENHASVVSNVGSNSLTQRIEDLFEVFTRHCKGLTCSSLHRNKTITELLVLKLVTIFAKFTLK